MNVHTEWLRAHPYLERIARFQQVVDAAAEAGPAAALPEPRWGEYGPDFAEGVPLLHSAAAGLDLAPAGALWQAIAARVAAADVPGNLAEQAAAVREALARSEAARTAAVRWLVTGDGEAPGPAGVARHLGWAALERVLRPVVQAWATKRDDDRWARPECPTCGAEPVMAQLQEQGAGRRRQLVCGLCHTQWTWKRLGCPFCGNEAQGRLETLEVEGEPRLRIDACRSCQGYVKTYDGRGQEDLFLADWTTLHLDTLARDRGYTRRGHSLYEL